MGRAPTSEAGVCVVAVGVPRYWRATDWPRPAELLHEALRLPERQAELGGSLGGGAPPIGSEPLGGPFGRR